MGNTNPNGDINDVLEQYARALKELIEAEKYLVASGFMFDVEGLSTHPNIGKAAETYFAQRYVRIQNLVDGRKPKAWNVKTFEEIEYD